MRRTPPMLWASKLAAEEAVRAAGVPFTILRPVLIYGEGVKGNFARLMELAHKPWPLPLGLCRNRRSLLARRNLIDAIHLALASPAAKGETYVVADPSPLTLAEIVAALRAGEGRSAGLLPVPPPFIALGAVALGRTDEWQRLHGKMVVDPAKLLNGDGNLRSTRAPALWLWPAPTRLQWQTDFAVITSRSDDGRAATSSDGI